MAKKGYIDVYKCREAFYNDVLSILSDDTANDRANEIIEVFDSLPSADVQEVVRCKDCKYFLKYKSSNECFCYKGDLLSIVKPDDYCSQSVRIGDNMNEI